MTHDPNHSMTNSGQTDKASVHSSCNSAASDEESERTCRYCRSVKQQDPDYRCVLCDPREGDLQGV